MAHLDGLFNAGADAYANPIQADTDTSFQNVSFVASNFNDPNWTEPVLPTTFAQNDPTLLAHLSEARKYESFIRASAERAELLPSIIAGIGSRESGWGLSLSPPGPGGTGDFAPRAPNALRSGSLPPDGGGFGRGLMQIDWDAFPFARSGNWRNPVANIDFACGVVRQNFDFIGAHINLQPFDLLRAAIAAYNAGAGRVLRQVATNGINAVDLVTTGLNYSSDVLNRAGWFQAHGFWRQVATAGAHGMGIVV
jgi:soluble lytic murein transglycosylase-like protein